MCSESRSLSAKFLNILPFFLVCILFPPDLLAQSSSHPGNIPLATRSIYVNTRLNTQNLASIPRFWPSSAVKNTILGWAGYAKVDNASYYWLGDALNYGVNVSAMAVTSLVLTPTRTVITFTAGTQMVFNVTYLSPIEPDDFVNASIPFSYVAVEAHSLDGSPHDVQIYSDISGEWVSGDRNSIITWSTRTTSPNIIHSVELVSPNTFVDNAGQADWGNVYYATPAGSGVTYMIDSDQNCRSTFLNTSILNNTSPVTPRALNNRFPVFAMSHDLGQILQTTQPIVWAVGLDRDPAVMATDSSGKSQARGLYYKTKFNDTLTLLNTFLDDYGNALARAVSFDANLTARANAVVPGGTYADLFALAARQTLSNVELTVGSNADGSWNTSDVIMFMREGDDNYDRTQPVELLYSTFPFFMVLNPSLGAPLLKPLLLLQSPQLNSSTYAASDLGNTYPKIFFANAMQTQAVEQTGNMLIMCYAQAYFSGDHSLVQNYYGLLRNWTDYLVDNSLSLGGQVSTDSNTLLNGTNLAIKGIIGIKAMANIASLLDEVDDAHKYATSATSLYSRWKSAGALGTSGNMLASFGSQGSYSTGYNLFADKWLNLSVVEPSVYNAQVELVENLLSSGTSKYGIPSDSSENNPVTTSWNMFVAGFVNRPNVQSDLISRIHAQPFSNLNGDIWPLVYDGSSGATVSGNQNPGQAAAFALIALSLQPQSQIVPPGSPGSNGRGPQKRRNSPGAIAGGVIGGFVGVTLLAGLVYFLVRGRRNGLHAARFNGEAGQIDPFVVHDNARITGFNPEMLVRTSIPEGSVGVVSAGSNAHSSSTSRLGGSGGNVDDTLERTSGMPLTTKAISELRRQNRPGSSFLSMSSRSNQTAAEPQPPGAQSSSGQTSSTAPSGLSDSNHASRLLAEVSLLRREVAQFRTGGFEPPPQYN